MADPTRTNQNSGESNVATTTATFGFTATAGRLLHLVVCADDYKTGDPSGWTLRNSQQVNCGFYVWEKIAAGGETSVQYTIGSATRSVWTVQEHDNIDTIDVTPVGNSDNTNSSTVATGNITPSSGRRLLLAFGGTWDSSQPAAPPLATASWTNGFAEIVDRAIASPSTPCVSVSGASLIADYNGSTAVTTGATLSQSTTSHATAILAYKVVTGGINVTPTGVSSTAAVGAVVITGTIPRVDYVSHNAPVESSNADITFTEPAGTQQGDLLVVAIAHRSAVGFQKPADWTSKLLDQSSGNTSTTVTSSIASGELFYTVRGASAPTLTFTKEAGTGDVNRGVIVCLRGQDTTTPIRASLQTTLAANSNTVVTGGTISPQIGDLVLAAFCGADNITWSAEQINGAPTALVEIADAGSNTGADNSIGVAYLTIINAAITTQTVQATASGTNSRHVVLVIDVAPQATSTPVTVTLGAGPSATASTGAPTVAVHQLAAATGLSATATCGAVTVTGLANTAPAGQAATVTGGTPVVAGAAQVPITVGGSVTDPAFINAVGSVLPGTGSSSASPALSTTTGNFLFVAFTHYTSGVNITEVIDSAGNIYTKAGTTQGGDANQDNEIWFTANPITGHAANVATVSTSGPAAFRNVAQAEFSWSGAGSVAYDAEAAHALVTGPTWLSNSLTTTAVNALVLGNFVAFDNMRALANSTGTMMWQAGSGTDADDMAFAYRLTDAPGSYSIQLVQAGGPDTDRYSIIAKAVKPTAASTGSIATVGTPTVTFSSGVSVSVTGLSASVSAGVTTQTAAAVVTLTGRSATVTCGTPGVATGDLTWSVYSGATSYRLYWGTTSALYTQNVNVGNVLSYPISSLGLATNTTYYIQVRAFDGAEHDHEAEKVVLNGVIATNPFLVLLVSGLGATVTRATPNITAASSYTLTGRSAATTIGTVTVSAVGNANVDIVGISATVTRGDVVAAMVVNVPVIGLPATATVGVPTPGAPVSVSIAGFALAATRGNPGAFGGSLAWNTSPTAISYRIYWGTTTGVYTQSVDVGNVLSYSMALLGLQRETTYYSVVRAWDGALESANSGEIILFNGGMLAEPYTMAVVPGRGATVSRGNVTVAVNSIASPVGRSAAATLGAPTVQTTGNVTVTPTTVERTATIGTPVVTAPAVVPLTSPVLVSALGNVVVIAQVNESVLVSVTGLSAAAFRGNANVIAPASVTLAGVSATATRGVPVASINVSVGAVAPIALSAARGIATIASAANVTPIGVSVTGQTGNAVVVSNVVTNLIGSALTSELNALDIDVVATVDYQPVGQTANILLGPSAVTIEGSISFGIDGVLASANYGALQHIGTAVVSIGGHLQTSSLNSPAVTATQVVQIVGRSSAVTVGTTTVLTAAGEVSVDVAGQMLSVFAPTAVVSIDSVYALPPGFYSVSALGGISEFKYGMDVYVDGIQLTADVNPVSFSNDVNVLAGVLTAATYIGTVHVAQQGDATPIGLPSTCSLGNVKARTRNPHSHWVNVMVRSSRSIFRSGRMW